MATPFELRPARTRHAVERSSRPRVDWRRLVRSESPTAALEELGACLGSGVTELSLSSHREGVGCLATWRRPGTSPGGEGHRRAVVVSGSPDWELAVVSPADDPATGAEAEQLAMLLEAWRQVRAELVDSERDLGQRTRELDTLQLLGQRAAEARTARDLFVDTVSVLHRSVELELGLIGCEIDGRPRFTLFLARPFPDEYLESVQRRASGFLGWTGRRVEVKRVELDGIECGESTRCGFREEDLVLLPVLQRGRPSGCLVVVPGACPDERQLRLLYSASNQLALHLDRVLTIREAEADRFRAIVDSMPQGVLMTDGGLRILQANAAARKMLDSLGLGPAEQIDGLLDRLGLRDQVETVRGGKAPLVEGELRLEETDTLWNITASPLLDDRRRVDGLLLVLADVTESRRLQQQLAQSEKMSSLGQMISGVAHELNNPLASIVGYTQLLRSGRGEQRVEERLEILGREAERCRKIVGNLLSFVRHREPERRPLSLNQSVTNVLALLEYQLRVSDVQVETDLDPALPAMHGDAHQLEQILVNLLTNARHAIRQAGRCGGVVVRTVNAADGAIVLEVSDDGPGIPAAIRTRIFDPFFTTKQAGHGTGLGLSLVYGIVTAHGGSIDAVPGAERGTTFRMRFPVDAPAPAKTESRPVGSGSEQANRGPARVLVVDDEEPLARMICDVLAAEGHLTERAGDGGQALELLARREFDLIVSDMRMPGVCGARLAEELRAKRPALSGRLLLTTGDTVGPEADALVARHDLEVLRKPFDLDELRDRVRAMLSADRGA